RQKRMPFRLPRRREPQQVQNRREKIDQVYRIRNSLRFDPRAADNQRHHQELFIERLLMADAAMFEKGLAVVRRDDDDGIVEKSVFFQTVEEKLQLIVDEPDAVVVTIGKKQGVLGREVLLVVEMAAPRGINRFGSR